ncbi:MAG: Holliday junction branch migration protein RuvA [Planctomycetota bacterium]
MYDSITGRLARIGLDHVSVVSAGIGYRLHIPTSYLARLGARAGQEVTFFTHLHVTDADLKLFAFENEAERDLFKQLQSVSGVGPSLALALISGAGPATLVQAIAAENLVALTKIRGVGRKTAERLCLELKDKLQGFLALTQSAPAAPHDRAEELVAALLALGYAKHDARRVADQVLNRLPAEKDLEVLLKNALAS